MFMYLLRLVFVFEVYFTTLSESSVFEQYGFTNENNSYTTFPLNFSCEDDSIINISDLQIWYPVIDNDSCSETMTLCNLTEIEKGDVKMNCNNQKSCTRIVNLKADCPGYHGLAFYSARKKETTIAKCQPVKQDMEICNYAKGQLTQAKITFHPWKVEACLQTYKINLSDKIKQVCNFNPVTELDIEMHKCLEIHQIIKVLYSCNKDTRDFFTTSTSNMQIFASAESNNEIKEETTEMILGFTLSASKKEKRQDSKGPIIGGLVGGVAMFAVVVVIIIFICRKRTALEKRKQRTGDKSPMHQDQLRDFNVVHNVAYSDSTSIKPREIDIGNCYQEIPDSLMNANDKSNNSPLYSTENDGYCFANPIKMAGNHNREINSAAEKMVKPLTEVPLNYKSTNHNYLDLPSQPFIKDFSTVGVDSENSHYDSRGSNTYDTAQNQPRPRATKSDDANLNYNRVGGTYDTSHHKTRSNLTNQENNLNPYDLRISGTYDTSQSQTNPSAGESVDDVNPYNFRISGTYDTSRNVAGEHIKYYDDSANAYDHFFGQKDDGDYDHVIKSRNDIGKNTNIYRDN